MAKGVVNRVPDAANWRELEPMVGYTQSSALAGRSAASRHGEWNRKIIFLERKPGSARIAG
jgi:hypothetical protein